MARTLAIEDVLDGTTHVLVLAGRLDTNTAPALDSLASRIFAADASADVVVDMERCEFVSSAGLRVIVAMQKRATAGGSLTFRKVSPGVMEVLSQAGFDRILTIE